MTNTNPAFPESQTGPLPIRLLSSPKSKRRATRDAGYADVCVRPGGVAGCEVKETRKPTGMYCN
jgi:hypothetical protein